MNAIRTKEMLAMVGQYILKNESEFQKSIQSTNELEKKPERPYVVGFMSYLIFANESEAISIASTANVCKVYSYLEAEDTQLKQWNKTEESFCFSQEMIRKTERAYKEAHKRESKEDTQKWLREKLFLVEDYNENFELIKEACLEINWYMTHNALGDLKSPSNKKHYDKIVAMAQEWSKLRNRSTNDYAINIKKTAQVKSVNAPQANDVSDQPPIIYIVAIILGVVLLGCMLGALVWSMFFI